MIDQIVVRNIQELDYSNVHPFQCEYLDDESFNEFLFRVGAYPDYYLVAYHGDDLAGICYGHPSGKNERIIQLQGIAVDLDESKGYARQGIGSKMIDEFEKIVKHNGHSAVDLGSADDFKVEQFYLKNGFQPYELVAKDTHYEEIERIKVYDYKKGKVEQAKLRAKHSAHEVIFIFHKHID